MKHRKRLAACLLTAALTVSTLCTGAFAWNTPTKVAHRFADVSSSDWFCDAVQTAFDKGYMMLAIQFIDITIQRLFRAV